MPGIVEQADDGVVQLLEPIIGVLLLQRQSAILRDPKKALCLEAVSVPNAKLKMTSRGKVAANHLEPNSNEMFVIVRGKWAETKKVN